MISIDDGGVRVRFDELLPEIVRAVRDLDVITIFFAARAAKKKV